MIATGQLPKDWQWVKLGEVCTAIRGVNFPSHEASYETFENSIACLTTGSIQDEVAWPTRRFVPLFRVQKNQIIQPGDLLVSTANSKELVGKSCSVSELPYQATFGAFVTLLRPTPAIVPDFLNFTFRRRETAEFCFRSSSHTTGISNLRVSDLLNFTIPLPPLAIQRQIASSLREQTEEVQHAGKAIESQRVAYDFLIHALLRESLANNSCQRLLLGECLNEVTQGIGERWAEFPVLGATRAGLALAKEPVGKQPGRYKPVVPGTIFYNPMRILLGSIAMIDDDDQPGITSPDYVAMRGVEGKLHPRWFYHWFRSVYGAEFIKSLTRGAVRERLMFKRLAPAQITVPDWLTQLAVAAKLKEIKRAKVLLEQRLAEIERLPAALLRQVFWGIVDPVT